MTKVKTEDPLIGSTTGLLDCPINNYPLICTVTNSYVLHILIYSAIYYCHELLCAIKLCAITQSYVVSPITMCCYPLLCVSLLVCAFTD